MQSFSGVAKGARRHRIRFMRRRNHCGLTLLELCFGLAIVAVLAGLAAPGFQSSLRAGAVRSAAFEVMAGIQQTRADAIVHSRTGVWCLASAEDRCLSAGSPAGAWSSFLEGEPGHGSTHALPRGVVMRASRPTLRFWPSSLGASTGTLTICDARGLAAPRAIVISQTGRARFAAPDPAACA
jgi:type IV fimbrial biogenesis protein FimT